jgi:hypothetical protein
VTSSTSGFLCLILSIDTTYAYFFDVNVLTGCASTTESVELGSLEANVLVTSTSALYMTNPSLHNWNLSSGDLGLSYNQSCTSSSLTCGPSAFQQLLLNSSSSSSSSSSNSNDNNTTFGLDFRDANSSIASVASRHSTMQLGGVDPRFEASLDWLAQPTQLPYYHMLMLENLQFCGTSLLGNYSTTWPVMVDTGSSCLSLPAEIYDSFAAWFDNSTVVDSLASLPAFSFALNIPATASRSAQTLFVPLGVLAIDQESTSRLHGIPTVEVLETSSSSSAPSQYTRQHLCVLRGANIVKAGGVFADPPPAIVFGSLVLQSLYFAADFRTASEGLANKLSAAEVSYYGGRNAASHFVNCARPTNCSAHQSYSPTNNHCDNPSCDQYFFVRMDPETKQCVYKEDAMGLGLTVVAIVLLMEVVSFATQQYTAYTLAERSRRLNRTPNCFYLDPISYYFSMGVTAMVDFLLKIAMSMNAEEHDARQSGEVNI